MLFDDKNRVLIELTVGFLLLSGCKSTLNGTSRVQKTVWVESPVQMSEKTVTLNFASELSWARTSLMESPEDLSVLSVKAEPGQKVFAGEPLLTVRSVLNGNESTIAANANGVLVRRADPATGVVTKGQILFEIGTGNEFRGHIALPQGMTRGLRRGEPVRIELPFVNGREATGYVRDLSDDGFSFTVQNDIHNLNRQQVRVGLSLGNLPVWGVRPSALFSPTGGDIYLLLVDKSGTIKKVGVRVMSIELPHMVVYGKLEPDSRVVIRGLDNLLEGDRVLVEEKSHDRQ